MSLIGVHISRITSEIPSVFLREDAQSGSLKTCRVLYRFTDQNKKLKNFICFIFSQDDKFKAYIPSFPFNFVIRKSKFCSYP